MSYPALTQPQPRSALLSNLRGQNLPPPPAPSSGRATNSGYAPRLPPHTPQHRQRFPSSEHTLGPSFDDDDEDEEMVAKMAALNAGVYPYQGPQQGGGAGGAGAHQAGGGMMPRGQMGPGPGGLPRGGMDMGRGLGGGDRGGPPRGNQQQQQQQQQLAYQQQLQQQELLRMLTLQTLQQNQGPRNLEELQLLQALAQQQQQREMEAQVEQLLRLQVHQQAQQLQQQLIAQAQQAAMLAAQPNHQQRSHPLPPPLATFNQRSFDQSYAQAQAQVQMANQAQRVQQTPQQLASAYEQRHAAQQQIQANLRARSAVPPLPTPAAVAASGHRFGFEVDQPRDDVHGAGIFGNGGGARQTLTRGLSPQPGAGAVGERTGVSPDPAAGSQVGGDRNRVASPLDGGVPAGVRDFGGLAVPSSQGGTPTFEYEQRDANSLAAAASLWSAGKSDASGNWRTKSADSPPPSHPRTASTGGVVSPPVSRFSGTFSPPPHARETSSTSIGSRFQTNNGVGLDQDAHSDSSSHPSVPNSGSDENEGSRSPTSSEGNTVLTSGRASWGNVGNGDILKPIYEGIGLGRPFPSPQQPHEKPTSPTGFGGGSRAISMSAAAAALNTQSAGEVQQVRRGSPGPVDVHPRTRSYDLGGGVGNGGGAIWGSVVTRQPRGPPSPADELGARNFASRLRKKAGNNLSLLGRREQTPTPSA